MKNNKTVAILGAGKLGVTLAQLATKAGYSVRIAGSGDPSAIELSIKVLVPGAVTTSASDAPKGADMVILALPLGKYRSIDVDSLRGMLVIDGMNYWWEVDGDEFASLSTSSSEMIQKYLSGSRVVKALSHMGYHHLHDEARPKGAAGRKAIAIAGDSDADTAEVAEFVDAIGFDPLQIGPLKNGRYLEPSHPAFGANLTIDDLQRVIT
jgi:predicted dinucleotide-binding enzyme